MSKTAAAASSEDHDVIAQLKSTLKSDPSEHNPHYFCVHPQLKTLKDSMVSGPQIRRDVMPELRKFAANRGEKYPSYTAPKHIISVIELYPSLSQKISAIAFKEMDEIEATLTMHLDRPKALVQRDKARLQVLTNSMQPVRHNWIYSLRRELHHRIDDVVNSWLDEPVDYSEKLLFKEGWEAVPYSQLSAKRIFAGLPAAHQEFLGLEIQTYELVTNGKSIDLYRLAIDIAVANKRAKALGLKLRFEAL
jgi:hypothetical protein